MSNVETKLIKVIDKEVIAHYCHLILKGNYLSSNVSIKLPVIIDH